MKLKSNILILFILLTISCKKEETTHRFPLAEEHNISEAILVDAFNGFKRVDGSLSLVVSRDGEIVAEDYYNGSGSDSIHDVRSVTKSFTSLLVGLAIDKGYIESINDPISKYLTGIVTFPDQVKANITIDQMLKMSFGHAWNGTHSNSLYNTWASTPDHLQYIIDLPLANQPGMVFNYSDGASHLLSVIIAQATGQNTLDFAKENLFDPLEISNFRWGKDDLGYPNGAAGLTISPHDMLKLGYLILSKGKYKETQVVPESWITEMTTTKISTNNDVPFGPDYSYQIWIGSANGHKYIFAMGWGGQFVFTVPDQNLVVIATCSWSGVGSAAASDHWNRLIRIIVNQILPAVN